MGVRRLAGPELTQAGASRATLRQSTAASGAKRGFE
jgi:hypothetical protein